MSPSSASYTGTKLPGTKTPIVREVNARFAGGARDEIHVDRLDGGVMVALSPQQAFDWIQRDNMRLAHRHQQMVITRITWDNAPENFSPPKGHNK